MILHDEQGKNTYIRRILLLAIVFSPCSFVQLICIMRFSSSVAGFAPFLSLVCAAPSQLESRDLNSFIAHERAIALQGALANIGLDGSQVAGAGNYVIASPSTANPDCEDPFQSFTVRHTNTARFLHLDSRLCFDHEDDCRRVHSRQQGASAKDRGICQSTGNPPDCFQPLGYLPPRWSWSCRT